jgi:hypothetical protein
VNPWRRKTALFLCAALAALQSRRSKNWARAIRSEVEMVDDDREALAFAWRAVAGLLPTFLSALLFPRTASPSALTTDQGRVAQTGEGLRSHPRRIAVICGAAAVALGLGYLGAAGAPAPYLIVNMLALLIGLSAFAILRLTGGGQRRGDIVLIALAGILLAATLFGSAIEGATRWIKLGSLFVQPSLILLPPMIVAFARSATPLSTLAIVVATITIAAQPDRAMVAVAFAGLLAVAVARLGSLVLVAASIAAIGLAYTLVTPDVDGILYSSFAVHPMLGVAVWAGSALLVVPAVAGWFADRDGRTAYLAFGAAWATAIAAAGLGNYPTPLVGFGGSAILGYLLSVAALPRAAEARRGTRPPMVRALGRRDEAGMRMSAA